MLSLKKVSFVLVGFTISQFSFSMTMPNTQLTPGVLCTPSDSDFKGYDYPSKVARCNRNIGNPEKAEVAKNYGNIPASEWVNYEFDHYIPLCAGGSNNIQNLWPQPIAEAKQKDVIEVQVCTALKAGTMTQDQALQKIHDWFTQFSGQNHMANSNTPAASSVLPDTTNLTTTFIDKNFSCLEKKPATDSKIKITFTQIGVKIISNLQVQLLENNGENELLNLDRKEISGKVSKTKAGPLNNLLLFAVQSNQDRFDLYLPQNIGEIKEPYNSFFKISFEDSYPNLVNLVCTEL
ncbi:MAG: hypothetical protein WA160_01845 [Pseudobdellovibrio sp.]